MHDDFGGRGLRRKYVQSTANEPSGDSAQWHSEQRTYWNSLAGAYDRLYSDNWSRRENRLIQETLRELPINDDARVLDLGCGTGLGFELLSLLYPGVKYHGRDLSEEMLRVCAGKFPKLPLSRGRMEDLGAYQDNSFDLVTCLFASASYAMSLTGLVREVWRVLCPGGHIYLSCLNRWSLRRLLRAKVRRVERYRTRGDTTGTYPPPVFTYGRKDITHAFADEGFAILAIDTLGGLSGIHQNLRVWTLSRYIAEELPIGHSWEVVGRKL